MDRRARAHALQGVLPEIVALEGKALRRALNQDGSIPYIVSVWAEGNGLVLGQWKVANKNNEIAAVLNSCDCLG